MKWLELTVYTTDAGIDAVCADKQKITDFYRGAGI